MSTVSWLGEKHAHWCIISDTPRSARSAVLVLPPVRFCGPLAEPAVRLSTQRALHGYRPVAVLKPREAVFLRPGSDSG